MPLPELMPSNLAADVFIRRADGSRKLNPLSRRPLLDEDGEVWLVVDQCRAGTVLSFPRLGDFVVDLEARRITCHLDDEADVPGVRHALLDHVVPRLLVATGSTVLHASGVVIDGRAVLFAGPSGAGKSTLAARCAALGCLVLADDATVIERVGEQWNAQPSYPGLRLWRDSIDLVGTAGEAIPLATGSPKSRVGVANMADAAHELSSIVLIERRPGTATGRRLTGAEAFAALWATVFAWPTRLLDEELLDRVTALAGEVPVVQLAFPDATAVGEILSLVAEGAGGR